MNKEQDIYQKILRAVNEDTKINSITFVGNCRIWSREVLLLIRKFNKTSNDKIIAEARESEVEPNFFHTFIRMTFDGENFYIFDGTGASGHSEPYFGTEQDAPDYLQKSKPDIINYYLPSEDVKQKKDKIDFGCKRFTEL